MRRSAWWREWRLAVVAGGVLLVVLSVGAVWYFGFEPAPPVEDPGQEIGVGVLGAASQSATAAPTAATTTPPATTAAPAGPSFPTSADAYARAALDAWLRHDDSRLGE